MSERLYEPGDVVNVDGHTSYTDHNPYVIKRFCTESAFNCYVLDSTDGVITEKHAREDLITGKTEPYTRGKRYFLGFELVGEYLESRKMPDGLVDYLFWTEYGYDTTREADRPAAPEACPTCGQDVPE